MGLLDFLKRKKEIKKAEDRKPEKKQPEKEAGKASFRKETKPVRSRKEVRGFSYEVIREPHISEKATNLGQINKYVFKIYKNTNKPEVKKAVEGIYGVDVLNVNIIKIPKKKRRLGRTEGFRKSYSKAVVTVKEGQKIEIL